MRQVQRPDLETTSELLCRVELAGAASRVRQNGQHNETCADRSLTTASPIENAALDAPCELIAVRSIGVALANYG